MPRTPHKPRIDQNAMIDAIREILGLKPLYKASKSSLRERTPHYNLRQVFNPSGRARRSTD